MNFSRSSLPLLFFFLLLLLPIPTVLEARENDEAIQTYFSANALYNRKLYTMAAEEYGAFLDKYPNHEKASQARLGLALCAYALEDRKKAEPLFAALLNDPEIENQQEVHNLHGQCLLTLDKPEEGEKSFAWSVNHGKDDTQRNHAMVGETEAQYRQSKWEDVIRTSQRFARECPTSSHLPRIRFQGAVALFEMDRFKEAEALLSQLRNPEENTPFMQHVLFLLAECHRELGQTPAAIRNYELAARQVSGAFTAEALYRLGYTRFQAGDYSTAALDFKELLDDHGASPSAAPARLYLGRCFLEEGDLDEAEVVFQSIAPSSRDHAEARLWFARTHIKAGNPENAEKCLARILEQEVEGEVGLDLLHEHARVLMDLDRNQEAARLFARLNKTSPDAAQAEEALWLMAYCRHKAGQYQKSYETCSTFLARYPDTARTGEVAFLVAENLFLMDKLAQAAPVFREFIANMDDHFYIDSAWFRLAQIHYYQDQWQEALQALNKVASNEKESPFFNQRLYIQGDCHFNCQAWDPAIVSFTRFIQAHPEESNLDLAAFKIGLAQERKGEQEKAISTYRSFVAHFPESPYLLNAYVELGRLNYEAGDYAAARQSFTRADELGENPFALNYLGYVCLAEGDSEQALEHFSTLEARYPNHDLASDALLQQAILRIRAEEYKEARTLLQRFTDSHEGHGKMDEAQFYLGLVLSRQEKWNPAIERFQTVIRTYPDSDFQDRAYYEWAWCEKGRGDDQAAARCYQELLRTCPESSLLAEVQFEIAELDYENQRHEAAISRLTPLLQAELEGDLRERVLYRLGWNCYAAGKFADGAPSFETLVKEYPRSQRAPIARYQAGESRLKLTEYEEAYQHFKALAQLGKKFEYHEQTLLRLGECAALTQRWQESGDVLRGFTKAYPESEFLNQALFGQGWAEENQERYPEAIQAYRKVLDRGNFDEYSARSQFQIGECHFAAKEFPAAVKALIRVEVVYAFPQWSSKALLEAGRALERIGKREEARARYQELVKKYMKSDAAVVGRERMAKLDSE